MEPNASRHFQQLDQCAGYPYTRGEYIRRFAWRLIQKTLFRFSPPRAFGWRKFLLRCFGARLQGRIFIRPTVDIMHPWLLTMDTWSVLADGVTVYNLGPIAIGAHTVISQNTYLCAGTHDYTLPDLPLLRKGITVGAGVWIAAQAFIGPGVTIGDNTVIGAAAVVVRDVPPCVVAAGNPAKVLKPRTMNVPESPAT